MRVGMRRVSLVELLLLIGFTAIDIGLLLYTALREWLHHGSEFGRPIFFLLPTLVTGGLFVIAGIHSLNATLIPDPGDGDSICEENLRVSPRYSSAMLIYGTLLLLVAIAGSIVDINLVLGR